MKKSTSRNAWAHSYLERCVICGRRLFNFWLKIVPTTAIRLFFLHAGYLFQNVKRSNLLRFLSIKIISNYRLKIKFIIFLYNCFIFSVLNYVGVDIFCQFGETFFNALFDLLYHINKTEESFIYTLDILLIEWNKLEVYRCIGLKVIVIWILQIKFITVLNFQVSNSCPGVCENH